MRSRNDSAGTRENIVFPRELRLRGLYYLLLTCLFFCCVFYLRRAKLRGGKPTPSRGRKAIDLYNENVVIHETLATGASTVYD